MYIKTHIKPQDLNINVKSYKINFVEIGVCVLCYIKIQAVENLSNLHMFKRIMEVYVMDDLLQCIVISSVSLTTVENLKCLIFIIIYIAF